MSDKKPKKQKLDDVFIASIVPPKSGDVTYWDEQQRGLGLRVWAGGSKVFVVRRKLNNVSRRMTLGPFPEYKVKDARAQAVLWNADWDRKLDPKLEEDKRAQKTLAEQADDRNTFGVVYRQWVDDRATKGADATDIDRRKVFKWLGGDAEADIPKRASKGGRKRPARKASVLWNTPFKQVTVELVRQAMKPYRDDQPPTAKKIYTYTNACFKSVAKEHGVLFNPIESWFEKVGIPSPSPKEKYLNLGAKADREWLNAIYSARESSDYNIALQADYVLCLLFWGGRATETAMLKIEHVHLDTQEYDHEENLHLPWACFVKGSTKTRSAHYFPLTPLACDILKLRIEKSARQKNNSHGWVFPSRETEDDNRVNRKHISGWGAGRLLDVVELQTGVKMRPHDLRRTLATELAFDTGYNQALISQALNHGRNVTAGYIQSRAKIEGLRAPFLKREMRLRRLLGLDAVENNLSDAVRREIQDPKNRHEILGLLGITL